MLYVQLNQGWKMRTIMNLFGRSPFIGLKKHMEKVVQCVYLVIDFFQALEAKDDVKVEELAGSIFVLEREADLIKDDIRNHLPKSLFMPIERDQLLEILHIQDNIADCIEDAAVLATIKPIELLDTFKEEFHLFLSKNVETFNGVKQIMDDMHELLESSFGGAEAEKVKQMVNEVAYCEHETDIIQRKLLKSLFKAEHELTYGTFFLWHRIFEAVAAISNQSEKLANLVRMTLDVK